MSDFSVTMLWRNKGGRTTTRELSVGSGERLQWKQAPGTPRILGRALNFPWFLGWSGETSHFNQLLKEKMSLAGTVSGPQVADLELTSLKNLPYNFHYPSMD